MYFLLPVIVQLHYRWDFEKGDSLVYTIIYKTVSTVWSLLYFYNKTF